MICPRTTKGVARGSLTPCRGYFFRRRWQVLKELASRSDAIPSSLWAWINERDHWSKEPSVVDQFDVLLPTLTGHSLKEEQELWTSLKELRQARNSLAHEGVPCVGKKELDLADTERLVKNAQKIVAWVYAKLPAAMRRSRVVEQFDFSVTKRYGTDNVPEGATVTAQPRRGHEDTVVTVGDPPNSQDK